MARILLLWAVTATLATADTLGGGSEVETPLWRIALALIICAGLAFGAAYVMRARLGLAPAGPPLALITRGLRPLFPQWQDALPKVRRLRLVESIRLNPQTQICLVSCDETDLIVAAGPTGVSVLRKREANGDGGLK